MALETGTHIDDLVATNPASGDELHTVDDHLRLIKAVLKASFPGLDDALLNSAGDVLSAKIPNLSADKVTSGRFDAARVGRIMASQAAYDALTSYDADTIYLVPV